MSDTDENPPPGGLYWAYRGNETGYYYIWRPQKNIYAVVNGRNPLVNDLAWLPKNRLPKNITPIKSYDDIDWDTETPAFLISRGLPIFPKAKTLAILPNGKSVGFLGRSIEYPFNRNKNWIIQTVYSVHDFVPEIFYKSPIEPYDKAASSRYLIQNVDWESDMGIPPVKVKPPEKNCAGDTIKSLQQKFGLYSDSFEVDTKGRVRWSNSREFSVNAVAQYDLNGDLLKYRIYSGEIAEPDSLGRNEDTGKNGEIIRPEDTVEKPAAQTPVQLEDLTGKPFDLIGMCRENKRRRQLHEAGARVNFHWLKPSNKIK